MTRSNSTRVAWSRQQDEQAQASRSTCLSCGGEHTGQSQRNCSAAGAEVRPTASPQLRPRCHGSFDQLQQLLRFWPGDEHTSMGNGSVRAAMLSSVSPLCTIDTTAAEPWDTQLRYR